MQSANGKQNNGSAKGCSVIIGTCDVISGGNEIHLILVLASLQLKGGRGMRKDEMSDESYFFPLILQEI